jgi:hypothetical protein
MYREELHQNFDEALCFNLLSHQRRIQFVALLGYKMFYPHDDQTMQTFTA